MNRHLFKLPNPFGPPPDNEPKCEGCGTRHGIEKNLSDQYLCVDCYCEADVEPPPLKIGSRVEYNGGEDPEYGVVTKLDDPYYFVLFDGDEYPQACYPYNLVPMETEPPTKTFVAD